jgi:hypothetical protein
VPNDPPEPPEFDPVSNEADQITADIPSPPAQEKLALAAAQKKEVEVVHSQLENVDFAKNIQAREKLAGRLFWLTLSWVAAIFAVILLQGFCPYFDLHDSVLIAFIGGTTANVIGLLAVVVRYFFCPPK